MKGICSNCKYWELRAGKEPCLDCKIDDDKFTPKETTMQDPRGNVFRVGDILVGLETGREILCEKIIDKVAHFGHPKEGNTFRLDQPSLNMSSWIKKEEPTVSHIPAPPTTSQILSAAEDCPDAKRALKRLYPKVFEEVEQIKFRKYEIKSEDGRRLAYTLTHGTMIILDNAYDWKFTDRKPGYFAKVIPTKK